MKKTVAIIGTLDTKGTEFYFLKEQIEACGCNAFVIDCGVVGVPFFTPDISNEAVARAGGSTRADLIAGKHAGRAMAVMAAGAAILVRKLYDEGRIHAAISMGGGQGTYLGMTAMGLLPIGVPKLMVSTLALVVKDLFTAGRDTMIVDPIVDVSGLNAMLRTALIRAAGAVCGMTSHSASLPTETRPVIGITMYGVTTKCVDMIREYLEQAGYALWVFHSTGVGGPNMEALIESGHIQGVIDLTVAEVSQTLLGGTAATISTRMEAAGKAGLPQVMVPGGIDVVNFLGEDSIPERYRNKGRKFLMHNPTTTLMRSNAKEAAAIAEILASKLNKSTAPVKVLLPLQGLSEYDKADGAWHEPESDAVLFNTLKKALNPSIEVTELNYHINDRPFAKAVADTMIAMMSEQAANH